MRLDTQMQLCSEVEMKRPFSVELPALETIQCVYGALQGAEGENERNSVVLESRVGWDP